MRSGTLPPPPRPPAAPPGPPPALPLRAPLSRRTRPAPSGRATRASVAGSLLLHLLLVVAAVVWLRFGVPATGGELFTGAGAPGAAVAADGTEEVVAGWIDVSEWPAGGAVADAPAAPSTPLASPDSAGLAAPAPASPAGEPLVAPSRVPDGIPPAPAAPGGAGGRPGGAPGAGTGPAGPSAREGAAGGRLAPGYADPRLYAPGEDRAPGLTELERYRGRLGRSIATFNDSVAEARAREYRLRNWTWTDSEGREWGIGEGGVPVVAGVRIPIGLEPPIPRNPMAEERASEERRQRVEIDRQAEQMERDRVLRDRIRAIRERQDSIRSERRGGRP